jgi:hypothetical protein
MEKNYGLFKGPNNMVEGKGRIIVLSESVGSREKSRERE